jgi:hypothetical protein
MGVLLLTTLLTSCGDTQSRAKAAGDAIGSADRVRPPAFPAYCRAHTSSGVTKGMDARVAWGRAENALKKEHARTDFCAEWYDTAHNPVDE